MVSERRIAACELLHKRGEITAEAYINQAGNQVKRSKINGSYDFESDDIRLVNETTLPPPYTASRYSASAP